MARQRRSVTKGQAAVESFIRTVIDTAVGAFVVWAMADGLDVTVLATSEWWKAAATVVLAAVVAAVKRMVWPIMTDFRDRYVEGTENSGGPAATDSPPSAPL